MANALNLFPVHVPTGRVTLPDGTVLDVLMTPEFARAMATLLVRVGGPVSLSIDDLLRLFATESDGSAAISAASKAVANVAAEQAAVTLASARIAALERRVEDLVRLLNSYGPAPVDWEHPGKIGAGTANSGKFTTLEATDKVKLNPANQPVEIKPTGAPSGGVSPVTIQPSNVGQIDNMELGKTAPQPARVTTLNKITFTQPATSATLTLIDGKTLRVFRSLDLDGTDGKTLTVSNSIGLAGTDGASLNIGAGGSLGSAAYQNTGAFAARSSTALAAVATDPASTQTLANSIRSVLISVGIGT